MKADLTFEDGAWWAVLNGDNPVHAFELDDDLNITSRRAQEKAIGWIWNVGWELGDIENPNRSMETLERPKVLAIKDWDGKDHWFVASEYADGEIGRLSKNEFASKEDAAMWLDMHGTWRHID